MATENRPDRVYFLQPRTQANFHVDADETSVLDHWLKDFDARQAALNTRQDEFFNKLGIQAAEWNEPNESLEPVAEELEEFLHQNQ